MAFKRAFLLTADTSRNSMKPAPGGRGKAKPPKGTRLVPEPLSREEVHYQLLHYHYTANYLELSSRADVDAHAVDYYAAISSGNPRELSRAAMLVFGEK